MLISNERLFIRSFSFRTMADAAGKALGGEWQTLYTVCPGPRGHLTGLVFIPAHGGQLVADRHLDAILELLFWIVCGRLPVCRIPFFRPVLKAGRYFIPGPACLSAGKVALCALLWGAGFLCYIYGSVLPDRHSYGAAEQPDP